MTFHKGDPVTVILPGGYDGPAHLQNCFVVKAYTTGKLELVTADEKAMPIETHRRHVMEGHLA